MKKKVAILGSSHFAQPLNFEKVPELAEIYTLVTQRLEMSLIAIMSSSVTFDRELLMSGKDDEITAQLLSEYEKDVLNDIVASNPDVLILDFFSDVNYGVLQTVNGTYLTNKSEYQKNPSFEAIAIADSYRPAFEFNAYVEIWAEALDRFMTFMKTYLPETKVVINGLRFATKGFMNDGSFVQVKGNPSLEYRNKVWGALDKFATENYQIPIISCYTDRSIMEIDGSINTIALEDVYYKYFAIDFTAIVYPEHDVRSVSALSKIDTDLNQPMINNIYAWNLIRNPKFTHEGKFWVNSGQVSFNGREVEIYGGELLLSATQEKSTFFNILSAPINVCATPEDPVTLELEYEVFIEDVFGVELNQDHVFIGRGFKNKIQTTHIEASQRIYTQQAKLLNITSGKWKKIKTMLTVTEPYFRVGPYIKSNTKVKWRNLSLKHPIVDTTSKDD
ncbi:hypothetical protein Hs30E_03010 [Lactococcus hodotermopsidis]|uniref:Uncharacterized protein n=1 Tax=Pseudolactococcus hodotermopsidis TaxID=2709157 RepID=A0A6A0B8L5_9LACT|nr:DUF6270 domain-containing protein [Lactococcus hodotermopsidis]GFH41750.1 hypothetical protein Hs30E_03010 [Lactococcus hodotermopsidis]